MELKVSSSSKDWTDFEKAQWEKADIEHYGRAVDWDKKVFHITAEENGEIVGSVRMDVRVGIAYIDAIIVDDSMRGKGIGRQLMEKAEQVAQDHNAHKIYLQTGADWDAVPFYEDLGYKTTSQLPNHHLHIDFIELTKFFEED